MFWKRSYWNPLTRIWVFKFLFKARKRRTEGLWVFQKHFVHDEHCLLPDIRLRVRHLWTKQLGWGSYKWTFLRFSPRPLAPHPALSQLADGWLCYSGAQWGGLGCHLSPPLRETTKGNLQNELRSGKAAQRAHKEKGSLLTYSRSKSHRFEQCNVF